MRNAFDTFFMFFVTLFTVCNRVVTSLDNYAKWAEAESSDFETTSAIARHTRKAKLLAEQRVELKSVDADLKQQAA